MWALRRFPTSKSLKYLKGFLLVSLKGQQEIITTLRNAFGEIEWKEATP